MVPNRVSVQMDPQETQELLQKIQSINTQMGFLLGLTKEERQKLSKPGNSRHEFIRKALEVGQRISEYLPRALDLSEMAKDIALMDALYPLMLATSTLASKLADTYSVASSEAYGAALVVYRNAKDAEGTEGLREAVAELKREFARRSKAGDTTDDPKGTS